VNKSARSKWPKKIMPLSPEQSRVIDDWMQHFHEVSRNRFAGVVNFNHHYVIEHSPPGFVSSLDVGAGLGEHLNYENLTPQQLEAYVAIEFRPKMAEEIRTRWPTVNVYEFDCQRRTPFSDGQFDRIIAIHLLEHLPDLPSFLHEARRLLNKRIGRLLVVIPCEGGAGYSLGRLFTSKRMFEKRYGIPYRPFIAAEHVNQAPEILAEIKTLFSFESQTYYPIRVPSVHLNLCIGLTLRAL
jgi:hypothetical protein